MSSVDREEYLCALTGISEDPTRPSASDGLHDLPVGWMQITFKRRQYNPEWIMLQQLKNSEVQFGLADVPEQIRAVQEAMIRLQVNAKYFMMEKEIPMYVPDVDETVHVSMAPEGLDTLNDLREMLGLERIEIVGGEDDEEDEEEEPVQVG